MANYNIVVLVGNLVRDVEMRTAGTSQVGNFTLAINHRYIANGEKKEEVSFIPVIVWGKQAENCSKYLNKGSNVLVEGRLKQETWDDKTSGEKRSMLKVVASNVQFLSMKKAENAEEQEQEDKYDDVPF